MIGEAQSQDFEKLRARMVAEVDAMYAETRSETGLAAMSPAVRAALGKVERHRLVPVDAVSRVRAHVRLERSDLHVDSGFEYDPALPGPVDYRPVYSYFGYTPFWEDGYREPYFLDRRW